MNQAIRLPQLTNKKSVLIEQHYTLRLIGGDPDQDGAKTNQQKCLEVNSQFTSVIASQRKRMSPS